MTSMRREHGFTLVELMIVIVIIGVLASISIPNYVSMQKRAKEGSTKANMHTVQLAAEDYGVQNDGVYSATLDASHIGNLLPSNFKNPFSGTAGSGAAWEDRATFAGAPTGRSGISSYSDSATSQYNIKGYGKSAAIAVTLTSGQ